MNAYLEKLKADAYSDELYQLLLRNSREARELHKHIRRVEKELAALGHKETELSPRVMLNLDLPEPT